MRWRIRRAAEESTQAVGVPEAAGVEVDARVEEDGFVCGLPGFAEGAARVGHDGVDGDGRHRAAGVLVRIVEFFILPG